MLEWVGGDTLAARLARGPIALVDAWPIARQIALAAVPLDDEIAVAAPPDVDLVALDVALEALAAVDARKGRASNCDFSAG